MGYVYALYNPCLQQRVLDAISTRVQLKIGMTTGNPFVRAKELSTTGLPTPFQVVWFRAVEDPGAIEKKLHEAFSEDRIAKNREFFWFPKHPKVVKSLLDEECDLAVFEWEQSSRFEDFDDFF